MATLSGLRAGKLSGRPTKRSFATRWSASSSAACCASLGLFLHSGIIIASLTEQALLEGDGNLLCLCMCRCVKLFLHSLASLCLLYCFSGPDQYDSVNIWELAAWFKAILTARLLSHFVWDLPISVGCV